MKTKVALINPGKSSRFAVQEPLNLGYIAAYLEKHGIDVRIIDQLAGADYQRELLEYKPDFAGITSTTPMIFDAYAAADFCRSKGIKTVMGGVHPWMFPEEALQHSDIVVKGEGEKAMLDIVEGRAKGPIIDAGYIANVDELPFPARHLVKMDRYLYCKKYSPYILHLPFVPANKKLVHILTSRGCPHSECIFCHNSMKRFPYRANSAEKVIEEIKQLRKDYGIEALYFVEDDFWADTARVVRISELMVQEGLSDIIWGCSARVAELKNTAPEVFEAAKKGGCRSITVGFETGSPRMLSVLKKGFLLDEATEAINRVKKAGLIIHGNIIIGTPSETLEDIRFTKKFISSTALVTPEIYIFTPYPGTQVWCEYVEKKRTNKELDWKKFNQEESVVNLSAIPTRQLNRLRAEMYILYYLTHPKYAVEFIFNTLLHPAASLSKIYHTIMPAFYGKRGNDGKKAS